MNKPEDFDEIIRARFSEQVFPFDEANWEKAELMIEKDRNRKKRRKLLIIFFSGWVAGIFFMLPFIFYNTNNHSASAINKNVPVKSFFPYSDFGIFPFTNETPQIESQNKIEKTDNETDNLHLITENNSKSYLTPEKQNNKNRSSDFSTQNKTDFNSDPLAVTEKTQTIINDNPITSSNISANDSISESRKKLPLFEKIVKKSYQHIPVANPFLFIDSLSLLPTFTSTNDKPEIKRFSDYLSFTAGIAYNTGWKYDNSIEANGLNPLGGIGFTLPFNSSNAIVSGIQFTSLGNLSYSEYTVKNEFPEFGINSFTTVYAARRLYYLQVPLKISRSVNLKNSFEIGGNFSYLFNSASRVKSYYENYSSVTLLSDKSENGYTEGFNPWNFSICVAYRRKINTRFSLTAEFDYGLSDIKLNDYPQNVSDKTERTTQLKLMLSYKLKNGK